MPRASSHYMISCIPMTKGILLLLDRATQTSGPLLGPLIVTARLGGLTWTLSQQGPVGQWRFAVSQDVLSFKSDIITFVDTEVRAGKSDIRVQTACASISDIGGPTVTESGACSRF